MPTVTRAVRLTLTALVLHGCAPHPPAVVPSAAAGSPAAAIAAAAVELAPGRGDSLDFTAVARLVGNARVVMLGEAGHGDGGAIELRGRLVDYLHVAGMDPKLVGPRSIGRLPRQLAERSLAQDAAPGDAALLDTLLATLLARPPRTGRRFDATDFRRADQALAQLEQGPASPAPGAPSAEALYWRQVANRDH